MYSVFDPVPDNRMRSFATDRPTKSDTPYTVDAGHVQYEADAINEVWSRDRQAGTSVTAFQVLDPTLKLGISDRTDVEVALSPLTVEHTRDRRRGTGDWISGFGDIYGRVKVNLLGDDGGDLALAVTPYVKAPTAAHQIGNQHWEGGATAPFIANLPDGWLLNITNEVDILENTSPDGMHTNYQTLINFSHCLLSDSLTAYGEYWTDLDMERAAPRQATLDFALAWQAKDTLQFDLGANIGLNSASATLQVYVGLSQRF